MSKKKLIILSIIAVIGIWIVLTIKSWKPAFRFQGDEYVLKERNSIESIFKGTNSDKIIKILKKERYKEVVIEDNHYKIKGYMNNYTVTYPEGEEITVSIHTMGGYSSGGNNKICEDDFNDIVFDHSTTGEPSRFAWGILVFLGGLLFFKYPAFGFHMEVGWKVKNAEPSEAYIGITKAGGCIAMIVAVGMMFSSCGYF